MPLPICVLCVCVWLLLGVLFEAFGTLSGGTALTWRDQPFALTIGTAWTLAYIVYLCLQLLAALWGPGRRARLAAVIVAEEQAHALEKDDPLRMP